MEKTIAAIATGSAQGGIGVIRLSGCDAVETAARIFKSADGTPLTEVGGYRAKFGRIESGGRMIDEAVALVFRAPKSYTGEDVVELSVHGGLFVVQKTLEAALEAGAAPAEPGEFTKRAFLNGKMDLTRAEGVAEVISANGDAALRACVELLEGALSRSIDEALQSLLDCSALMGAWVDYPDEEIPELSEDELRERLEAVRGRLQTLLDGYENGQIITQGVDTAIAGKPNAGKSTLMNLLSGRERSIVTDIEGTTRDIVEGSVRLGDIVLRLSDTAGIRRGTDEVERIGIERTFKKLETAQLIIAVFDLSRPLDENDLRLIDFCRGRRALAVVNKTDLAGGERLCAVEKAFCHTVYISAKRRESLDALQEAVYETLGAHELDPAVPLLANARQKSCCQNALDYTCEALDALAAGMTFDAINVMTDSAADELLALTGKKASEEVVNNIFSKFCVGK